MKKALLTINHNEFLSENARASFQAACVRWGCEYVEYTGNHVYHAGASKLRAFELCAADRVLVVDADTVIRGDAPDIFALCAAPETFYAVRNDQPHYSAHAPANRSIALQEIARVLAVRSLTRGVAAAAVAENFFNSGVWVASREHHSEMLARAFSYFDGVPGLQWWDQIPLNLAVHDTLGGYHDMGQQWNLQFPPEAKRMAAFIHHFAGNPARYELIKHVDWRA